MSHRALGPQFRDTSFLGDDHWEDVASPTCHYCNETNHTTTEHEVQAGWIDHSSRVLPSDRKQVLR